MPYKNCNIAQGTHPKLKGLSWFNSGISKPKKEEEDKYVYLYWTHALGKKLEES